MKPSLTLTLIFVAILSACVGGSTPTAPSQPSNSVQQINTTAVQIRFVPDPAVANETTTFIASIVLGSSSLSGAALDFGDGERADFGPISPVNSAELKHIYTRTGSFTASFIVNQPAGATASMPIPVIVR